MKVFIKGDKEISLTKNDFIAKGGEAEIYGKGNQVYKIYHSLNKVIPEAKIKELQLLNHDNILNPQKILLQKNNVIGFTMKRIKNSEPLCKLFTNGFRDREGIKQDQIIELIKNMKNTISFIHKNKCLIVDGNELNYLVNTKNWIQPYFIDVDSYQTPHFPATAIMFSIKDFHAKQFSELTDWFSFAIIACQLLVGIHPFKGKHPEFKKKDMIERMKNNVSIFNSKTRVPNSTRDFNLIPSNYLDWFKELFENGVRTSPPDSMDSILPRVMKKKIIQANNQFYIKLLNDFKSNILFHKIYYNFQITKTNSHTYINNDINYTDVKTEVLFTVKNMIPIFIKIDKNNEMIFYTTNKNYEVKAPGIYVENFMIINNTLYIKNEGKLVEIKFIEGKNIINIVINKVWQIMPESSQLFSCIVYQSLLGKPFLTIPKPNENGQSLCYNVFVPELEDYTIIDAKCDENICILIGFKGGVYFRIKIKFNDKFDKYLFEVAQTDNNMINFVVLDNGVVVSIIEDGIMQLESKNYTSNKITEINNNVIESSMKLFKDGVSLGFYKDDKVYSIKMNK